jgi:DNA polymerase-3 subunit alpha
MLKLYTEKGNKEKIAAIIAEMKKYKGIRMKPGQFGEDNRQWFVDKENQTISQSLSSIKFISPQVAEDLHKASNVHFSSFVDLLRYLQTDTCINSRQIEVLIGVGYFSPFGNRQKLFSLYEEFRNGKNKLTKTLVDKTVTKRIETLKDIEMSIHNEDTSICHQLFCENENIGLCLTVNDDAPSNMYFVLSIETTYGIKARLYNVKRGTTGIVKISKKTFEEQPFEANQCIIIDNGSQRPRFLFQNGKRVPIPGEQEYWMTNYHVENR